MSYFRTFLLLTLMGISAAMVSGCVGDALQSNKPEPNYYIMQPSAQKSPVIERMTIMLMEPTLSEGLNTSRIAVVENGRTLNYLARAEWSGTLNNVLKRFVLESLNQHEAITALDESNYTLSSDYRLLMDVSAMQAEYEGNAATGLPTVHFKAQLWLLHTKDSSIAAHLAIDEKRALEINSATAITAAFEDILRDMMDRLLKALPAKVGTLSY